ncbi:MAG TPA: histidine phosphatase family protein [Gammaproteobacteria bacterium]|nr:histidine phosphatase family protein [Gammaproteobacteria bacterium]
MTTIIDFIRHGEPVGGRRYRGSGIDDPLSVLGWQQMWDNVGQRPGWQRIISSPLCRCHAFATALASRQRVPLEIRTAFKEVSFGSWEGRSRSELRKQDPLAFKTFYQDPVQHRPPGAEALVDFGQRIGHAYQRLLYDYPHQHLLVVAHSGVIRAAIGHILQAPVQGWFRIRVDNGALTRIKHTGGNNLLYYHNLRYSSERTGCADQRGGS